MAKYRLLKHYRGAPAPPTTHHRHVGWGRFELPASASRTQVDWFSTGLVVRCFSSSEAVFGLAAVSSDAVE